MMSEVLDDSLMYSVNKNTVKGMIRSRLAKRIKKMGIVGKMTVSQWSILVSKHLKIAIYYSRIVHQGKFLVLTMMPS